MTTILLTPHATPVKVLTEDISYLLSTPAKTRHQKQVTVAKNARGNSFLKDRQVSFWKNKYVALTTSMRANVVRSIKEKLQRRNRQIDDLKLKLTPTRRAVRNERRRVKYASIVATRRKAFASDKLTEQLAQTEIINLVQEEHLVELMEQQSSVLKMTESKFKIIFY